MVAGLVVGGGASAQPSTEASRLFEEGRELAKQGNHDAACDRFGKSLALDPAPGTKLNLGDCLERQGQFREAWLMFEAAARDFDGLRDARSKFARDRANAASAKLATVVIKIADPELAGLAIAIGERPVQPDTEIVERIDPGSITIAVTAPGRERFETTATVKPGRTAVIQVPDLDVAGADVGAASVSDRPTRRKRSRVYLSAGLGLAGVLALAASGYLGVRANREYEARIVSGMCTQTSGELVCPDRAAADAVEDAASMADTATYIGVAGAVVAAGAIVVFITAPRERVIVTPLATSTSVGLAMGGRF